MRRTIIFVCTIGLLFATAGCGAGQVFGPTITPSPTYTPLPSKTPTSELPVELTTLFEGLSLTYFEGFEKEPALNFILSVEPVIIDGTLELPSPTQLPENSLTFGLPIHKSEGIVIDFKFSAPVQSAYSIIAIKSGIPGRDSTDFKVFSATFTSFDMQINALEQGEDRLSLQESTDWLKPNTWYRLVLAIDENGKVIFVEWERDSATPLVQSYLFECGESWANSEWRFEVVNHLVAIDVDNFYTFSFTSIKESVQS